ncbi:hypothetical protein Bca52824_026025 [Brassica carinata]|uniref:Uncharacterized protein n=1 Tax=Brassica carinata TaxID=52824 RepID=A0A8X7SHA3_BRACI|nr:hypothetical protein Bca52824_026025 [Brassica carinata]
MLTLINMYWLILFGGTKRLCFWNYLHEESIFGMGDTGRGFPTYCRCSARVSRHTSHTRTNLGRLFHSFPLWMRYNNRFHLFKWTDESMVEEIEDMKQKMEELETASLTTEKSLQVCEYEIETATLQTRTCFSVVRSYEKELRGLEKDIKDVKMELKSLKNMTVCVVVLGLFYRFFM